MFHSLIYLLFGARFTDAIPRPKSTCPVLQEIEFCQGWDAAAGGYFEAVGIGCAGGRLNLSPSFIMFNEVEGGNEWSQDEG